MGFGCLYKLVVKLFFPVGKLAVNISSQCLGSAVRRGGVLSGNGVCLFRIFRIVERRQRFFGISLGSACAFITVYGNKLRRRQSVAAHTFFIYSGTGTAH